MPAPRTGAMRFGLLNPSCSIVDPEVSMASLISAACCWSRQAAGLPTTFHAAGLNFTAVGGGLLFFGARRSRWQTGLGSSSPSWPATDYLTVFACSLIPSTHTELPRHSGSQLARRRLPPSATGSSSTKTTGLRVAHSPSSPPPPPSSSSVNSRSMGRQRDVRARTSRPGRSLLCGRNPLLRKRRHASHRDHSRRALRSPRARPQHRTVRPRIPQHVHHLKSFFSDNPKGCEQSQPFPFAPNSVAHRIITSCEHHTEAIPNPVILPLCALAAASLFAPAQQPDRTHHSPSPPPPFGREPSEIHLRRLHRIPHPHPSQHPPAHQTSSSSSDERRRPRANPRHLRRTHPHTHARSPRRQRPPLHALPRHCALFAIALRIASPGATATPSA